MSTAYRSEVDILRQTVANQVVEIIKLSAEVERLTAELKDATKASQPKEEKA